MGKTGKITTILIIHIKIEPVALISFQSLYIETAFIVNHKIVKRQKVLGEPLDSLVYDRLGSRLFPVSKMVILISEARYILIGV